MVYFCEKGESKEEGPTRGGRRNVEWGHFYLQNQNIDDSNNNKPFFFFQKESQLFYKVKYSQ